MIISTKEQRTAQAAAASLSRTYGMDPRDIQQEMYVWMYGHAAKVQEFRDGKPGLRTTLTRLGVKFCKREWRRANGGPFPDQYAYSRKALKGLLPQAFSSDLGQLSGAAGEYTGGSGDPALGGDLLASLVDVRNALQQLPQPQQQALLIAVDLGFDNALLGEAYEGEGGEPIGRDAANQRVNYYLDNMRKVLNGDLPPGAGYGPTMEAPDAATAQRDAETFYRRQLKGLDEFTGYRPSSSEAQQRFLMDYEGVPDGHLASLYYDGYGASWDND